MRKRDVVLSTALGAAVTAAIGYTTGQWRAGAFVGSGLGVMLAFLEHMRDERKELTR
jgi:hypothetical protein